MTTFIVAVLIKYGEGDYTIEHFKVNATYHSEAIDLVKGLSFIGTPILFNCTTLSYLENTLPVLEVK